MRAFRFPRRLTATVIDGLRSRRAGGTAIPVLALPGAAGSGATCLSVFLAAALAACAPTRQEGSFPSVEVTAVDAGPGLDSAAFDGSGQTLTALDGTWVLLEVNSTCVHVLASAVENFAYAWNLVNVTQIGSSVDGRTRWIRVTSKPCFKDLTPIIMDLAANVPSSMLQKIPPSQFVCTVTLSDKADPDAEPVDLTGASLACEPELVTWGLALDDPWNDPVPTDKDDPHVIDQDEDGNPGVTLILGDDVCDMYLVQRTVCLYEGTFTSQARLKGTFQADLQQKVLDGTQPLCLSENETTDNQPRNRLYLMRVDGFAGPVDADVDGNGQVTCSEVEASRSALEQEYEVEQLAPDSAQCK
jgi:hypothetical protein